MLTGEAVEIWPSMLQSPVRLVDRPTQLICISDIYLLICQQTNTKDIAGQSATVRPKTWQTPLDLANLGHPASLVCIVCGSTI